MNTRSAFKVLAATAVVGVASCAVYVARTWSRYGQAYRDAEGQATDSLLDRFMPAYDVVERHAVRISAPSEVTLAAACEQDLQQSCVVRAIFKVRQLILGGKSDERLLPGSLLDQVKALGWGVLAEIPGREIVMGAVTQPWVADVVFRALAPDRFATFDEPNYVKIVWTLRADPVDANDSVFRTETRAVATDEAARKKFRWYWSFLSPGIIIIRWMSLGPLKREAERRARERGRLVTPRKMVV